MSRINRLARAVMQSSLLWGGLAALGFYTLIHTGSLSDPFFHRYFASHWTLYAETVAFFVALAQLILRAGDLADQRHRLNKVKFDDGVPLGDGEEEARSLLDQLAKLPATQRDDYLPRRLRETLEAVGRKGSADEVEADLRYLSDVDAGRAHAAYAMVRLIIWAIPILGFLGTVIGITIAIAALDPKALEGSLNTVTGGLGVAFDTTALALALSMVLMAGQFVIDRQEQRLLADVDGRAVDLLMPRFPTSGSQADPQLRAVRKMAEAVVGSVERCVQRQAELWGRTIETAQLRWESAATAGRDQIEEAFGKALDRSMAAHRKHLLAAEDSTAEQNRKHWLQVQQALEASAAGAAAQQSELRRHGDALLRIVETSAELRKMEDSLERNLDALASTQQLQETLFNLTAAVSLLNARLERLTGHGAVGSVTSSLSKAA